MPCFRCGVKPEQAPHTPARFWRQRGWVSCQLCAGCLRECAGSLLYEADMKRIRAWPAEARAKWLASLTPRDRQAFEGGG